LWWQAGQGRGGGDPGSEAAVAEAAGDVAAGKSA
jgi:hypothetical protein